MRLTEFRVWGQRDLGTAIPLKPVEGNQGDSVLTLEILLLIDSP
ncbi:MAG: hypothetical protein ACRC8Y_24830 [Chroococcales cyanobacterium]